VAGENQLGRLPKRVFESDLEHCPNCGGNLKFIACILELAAINTRLAKPSCPGRFPGSDP